MTTRPHDVTDLYLAPVLLEIDRRLGDFEGLSVKEVEYQVALATDHQPRDAADRAALLQQAITHALDTHGWETNWAPRGLKVSHDDHGLVLGIPDSLRSYLEG